MATLLEAAQKLGEALRRAIEHHGAPNGFGLPELQVDYGAMRPTTSGRAWLAHPDVVRDAAGSDVAIEYRRGRFSVERHWCRRRNDYTRKGARVRPGRGQNEFVRASRMVEGRCPTHGVPLQAIQGAMPTLPTMGQVECPRADCDFKRKLVPKSHQAWDKITGQ